MDKGLMKHRFPGHSARKPVPDVRCRYLIKQDFAGMTFAPME
jgi:hypothetical protein